MSATALTLSAPTVVYGDEQVEQFTVTVSSAPGPPTATAPTGTVTVSAGATIVCTITLADGTGTCAPTADDLPVGETTLTGSYSGDDSFAPSSSPTVDLGVEAPAPATPIITTTTLGLSKARITYGDEQTEKVSVTVVVPGASGSIPVGTVTVRSGTTDVCGISLSSSGTGSCVLKTMAFPPGTAMVTATYAGTATGTATFGSSVSAAEQIVVTREPTNTTVSLSAGKIIYGAEQHERISVTVTPAHGGTPAGRVTVKAGSATICVITMRSIRGTCSPPATRLATGHYKLTAAYGGGANATASVSVARSLSVTRASSKTALSLSAAKVQYGSEGSATVSVDVDPQHAGSPQGKVTVKANGAMLAVISLESGQGSYTLSAKRLAAGTYTLVATYSGSADFTGSVSARRSLKVTSPPPPPPPPPACHPHTSGGNCYEPGEYCPDADHGLTGIAGDGKTIICEDNDGWRWEPVGNSLSADWQGPSIGRESGR